MISSIAGVSVGVRPNWSNEKTALAPTVQVAATAACAW